MLALAGAALLAGALLAADRRSAEPTRRFTRAADEYRRAITTPASRRALVAAGARLRTAQEAAGRPSVIAGASVRALRPALQSAILGLGVYLAATGHCPPGSALAASIVLPRILGPLEMALAHWRSLSAAHASAARLHALLTSPESAGAIPFPRARSEAAPRVRIVLRRAGA
jgi:ABC-type protease/lipase transport system fused ATPase/permease subunit